jgi:Ca-activated chloride channel family protein
VSHWEAARTGFRFVFICVHLWFPCFSTTLFRVKACLKARPVRSPGLHAGPFPALFCRPRALTRRIGRVLVPAFSLLLSWQVSFAQTADDFFHGGAVNYLSNNIPKALEVVTNGLAVYPNDVKLKKLEELLKQQQQQRQQQQKDEQQKQDEKKDQQSKQDQKDEQKKGEDKKEADKKEQEKKQDQQQAKQSDDKSKEKDEDKQRQMAAHSMTPQEAKQLLDAQKGDEKVLQFVPQGEPKRQGRTLKDW